MGGDCAGRSSLLTLMLRGMSLDGDEKEERRGWAVFRVEESVTNCGSLSSIIVEASHLLMTHDGLLLLLCVGL